MRVISIAAIVFCLIFSFCEPLVDKFEDEKHAEMYKAKKSSTAPVSANHISVMTWNIRFGAGRILWFGDSCGDRVLLAEKEVLGNLSLIADRIKQAQPDILLLQEVDVQSKRSAYIDQVQWLLDHTDLNYGAFASCWKVQYIPSDGLGRMNMGNAVLSRWPIISTERIKLPLRGDQDALTQYFYLRRNILKVRIDHPFLEDFYALDAHTSAFAKDNTKKKHIDIFKNELDKIVASGYSFVAGGDLNTLPPGAAKTYYCLDDLCPGEKPEDKEGCDFTREVSWLQPMYDDYYPAIPLDEYLSNELLYFTNSPFPDRFWQKKLDYLFSNQPWLVNSHVTHQSADNHSDHIPVSASWGVLK